MEHAELTQKIIGCGMKVHRVLGPGFVEVVYRNALAHELLCQGLAIEREKRLQVHYDGVLVGDFSADLLVEATVLVEIKATRAITPGNETQLVNYLTATEVEIGLLINFGGDRLAFKRKHRTYRPPETAREDGQEFTGRNGDRTT
jgi:GxxExxY protein